MTDSDRYQRVVDEARRLQSRGVAFGDALGGLRALSASPIDSIKAGRDVFGIPLGEAKLLVHSSETWRDCRDSFDDLHLAAERIANEH
jgi:hypothetical protein